MSTSIAPVDGHLKNFVVAIEGYIDGAGTVSPKIPTTGLTPVSVSTTPGGTNLATGQITTSTAAGTLVVARATRQSVLVRNTDATISVYVGPATVTSSNGMLLKAGESCPFTFVGLLQVIAASGTPVVAFADEYN